MPRLTEIPGLSPDAIEQLTGCGIESAEMLAGIPPAEIHRVLELTAWKQGRLGRAPTLDMVHHWASLAQSAVAVDDIPEAIIVPLAKAVPQNAGEAPAPLPRTGYVPPSQRARLAAAGPPPPAAPVSPPMVEVRQARVLPAAPTAEPPTEPVPAAAPPKAELEPSKFIKFEHYQNGATRVAPLNRYSIDAKPEHLDPSQLDRLNFGEELSRTVRRGVVHPNPLLLVIGAIISLAWRLALVSAIVAVPWLFWSVPRPSVYANQIALAALGLLALGIAQLVILAKARCRICSCHLFYSRNCVKNRKAHSIPLLGKTASLSLHLLLFQWFRCMYCGTAIKLWTARNDEAS